VIHSTSLAKSISEKRLWAAGTKTWFELAKKGLWVEGCSDGLGLEFAAQWWNSPLIDISQKEVQIITNTDSVREWKAGGWNALGTYRLIPSISDETRTEIENADIIFWTSFKQYEACKIYLKKVVTHCCPAGKTFELFLKAGMTPVVFPGIKAFNLWRKKSDT
jgi:hypothetical protein